MNLWDLWSDVFGVICVVGPVLLIVWYFRAAKEQLKRLQDRANDNNS